MTTLRNVSGGHLQYNTDDAKKLYFAKAGCIKICHPAFDMPLLASFHAINPTSPVALRLIDDSANFGNMRALTQQAIRRFEPAIRLLGRLAFIEILPNEHYTEGEELSQLSGATVISAKDIYDAGGSPLGFNLPVANPQNPADAVRMKDGAEALVGYNGAIGYHNYTLPGNQLDQNLDLRHELMAKYLPVNTRWWLNEGLFDHGIQGPPLAGWRYEPWHLDAEFASRYVRRIAQRLSLDKRVIGWTPFGGGTHQDWATFEYTNENIITQVFQEMYEVGEVAAGDKRIGTGFKRMVPYLGAPLEDEVYHFAGTPMESSLAVFENGTALWTKISNETVGIRSDGVVYTDKGNQGNGLTVWQIFP